MTKLRNVNQYLRGVTSNLDKRRIRRIYVAIYIFKFDIVPWQGFRDTHRECLHDAALDVQNDLESKGGGQPDHPVVIQINQARNHLMDDLGWNN